MSWNYRVFKESFTSKDGETEDEYTLREVYYEEDGITPKSYTSDPMEPYGNTLEELKADLGYMALALDKPILTKENFNGEG